LGFRLLALLLALFLPLPALADWYILLPKERRPHRQAPPKKAPLPKLSGKKEVKPYSVEVRKILAPSFVVYTPDMKRLSKEELSGKTVVFLFVKELFSPTTERLAKEFEKLSRKGTVFIIVDIDDADFIAARSFRKLLGLKRVLVTADSYIFQQFRKNVKELSVPSIVVIDKYGFIRFFSPRVSGTNPQVVGREVAEILRSLNKA